MNSSFGLGPSTILVRLPDGSYSYFPSRDVHPSYILSGDAAPTAAPSHHSPMSLPPP
ncbi:hypothetical protein AYI68_g6381, partial [Smittium mucronatum]